MNLNAEIITKSLRIILVLVGTIALALPVAAAGPLPEGEKEITLIASDGTRLSIGRVTFENKGEVATFTVSLDISRFREEFLSMRPFNCLPDPREMWCHLAYPYGNRSRVTANDVADLEYALLFLYKPPTAYGIDAWNGLYFKLTVAEAGEITGILHEVDLNVLAVTPAAGNLQPILPGQLTKAPAGAHRFDRVEIR